ncbi:hypothetical protein Tco_0671246 [Tanacetum coccineum]
MSSGFMWLKPSMVMKQVSILEAVKRTELSHLANNKDCFIRQRIVNGSWDWDWSRPITMGGTKTEFDNLILDIASLESDESVAVFAMARYSDSQLDREIVGCFLALQDTKLPPRNMEYP